MSLDKFFSILQSNQLHFTNATALSDQYEGTTPPGTIEHLARDMRGHGRKETDIEERLRYISHEAAEAKRHCWLNCWSIGREESYALWKIYLGGSIAGVAIQTNVKRLTLAIDSAAAPGDPPVMLARVKYSNHIPTKWATDWRLLTTKTKCYKYESELRLLIVSNWNAQSMLDADPSIGIKIPVDLDALVERIYLSPFCGTWFHEPFKSVLGKLQPVLADRLVPSRIRDR